MKILVALLLVSLPGAAATATVSLTLADPYIPAFRAYLVANHMEAVDTDRNGSVSNAEILAWLDARAQNMLNTFAERSVEWAEQNNPEALPAAHRTALTSKDTAEAALQTERAKTTQ